MSSVTGFLAFALVSAFAFPGGTGHQLVETPSVIVAPPTGGSSAAKRGFSNRPAQIILAQAAGGQGAGGQGADGGGNGAGASGAGAGESAGAGASGSGAGSSASGGNGVGRNDPMIRKDLRKVEKKRPVRTKRKVRQKAKRNVQKVRPSKKVRTSVKRRTPSRSSKVRRKQVRRYVLPSRNIPIPAWRPETALLFALVNPPTPTDRPPFAAAQGREFADASVPNEVLVTLASADGEAEALASGYGLQLRSARTSDLLGATLARYFIPDQRSVAAVLAQVSADDRVLASTPNHIYILQQSASPRLYAYQRVALDPEGANGSGVGVVVIDTAVDMSHPALQDVIAESYNAMPETEIDLKSHGTTITALIAGNEPFRGVAPGAKIFHVRAFENDRSSMDVLLNALDWGAAQKPQVVNMSFAGPHNDLLEAALAEVRARGIIPVAAAGNAGPGAPFAFPAAFDTVVAVTASDHADRLMPEANRGPYIHVAAPGVDLLAPVDGGMDFVTGTSMASAIATGIIANFLHANPDTTVDALELSLAETARDLGPQGRDDDFGFGLIDFSQLSSR